MKLIRWSKKMVVEKKKVVGKKMVVGKKRNNSSKYVYTGNSKHVKIVKYLDIKKDQIKIFLRFPHEKTENAKIESKDVIENTDVAYVDMSFNRKHTKSRSIPSLDAIIMEARREKYVEDKYSDYEEMSAYTDLSDQEENTEEESDQDDTIKKDLEFYLRFG